MESMLLWSKAEAIGAARGPEKLCACVLGRRGWVPSLQHTLITYSIEGCYTSSIAYEALDIGTFDLSSCMFPLCFALICLTRSL